MSSEPGPDPPRLNILVGVDDSPEASAAAEFALGLAARGHARVTLLHAGGSVDGRAAAAREIAEAVVAYERDWSQRLDALRQGTAGAEVSCRIDRGGAAGALIAAAIEEDSDIVVTGARGAGRLHGALVGSVAAEVLVHAPCSVLVFRDAKSAPGAGEASVIVGIDGSEAATQSLDLAQPLAVALDARLVLLHAFTPRWPVVAEPTEELRQSFRDDATRVLRTARERVSAPLEVIEERVVEDDPREALVSAGGAEPAPLLVVGGRGLGGFKELLLGSTARWLVESAPCPVLVARARHEP